MAPAEGFAGAREEKRKLSSAGLPRIPRELPYAMHNVMYGIAARMTGPQDAWILEVHLAQVPFLVLSSLSVRVPCCTPHPPPYLDDALSDRTSESIHPSSGPLAAGVVAPAGSRAEAVLAVLDRGVRWCSSRPPRRPRATPS